MDTVSTPTSGNWTDIKSKLSLPTGYRYILQNTGSNAAEFLESSSTPSDSVEPHLIMPNKAWVFTTETNKAPWVRTKNGSSGIVTVSKTE